MAWNFECEMPTQCEGTKKHNVHVAASASSKKGSYEGTRCLRSFLLLESGMTAPFPSAGGCMAKTSPPS